MRFAVRIGTPDGRIIEESVHADNQATARSALETKRYHVFEVRARGGWLPALVRGARGGAGRVNEERLLIFCQELASLLRAGLPLLQSLDLLLERQRDPRFRALLTDVRDRVRTGEELSHAFLAQGDALPPLFSSTLRAGERSGELEGVIRRFIRYLRLVMSTKKKVVSALVYPVVLVSLSLAMVAVMLLRVIPSFRTFFESADVELPWLTTALLGLSDFLRSRSGLVLSLGVATGVTMAIGWTRGGPGRLWLDSAKLRLPLVGTVLHRFSLSEFCRSLSTLLSGGLPLVQSLEVAASAVGNAYLRARLMPTVTAVVEGRALHQALEQSTVFPDLGLDMVKVGEATGALDEMLSSISDFFDEEVETSIQRMLSLIEPIMLVIMGISVAVLLLAMYLPLFSMLGTIKG